MKPIVRTAIVFIVALVALMGFYQLFLAKQSTPPSKAPTKQVQKPTATNSSASNAELNAPFDFYVLSLSWSPSFCEENRGKGGLQCSKNAPRPYAFIVHGLWPQNNKGWPENCINNPRTPKKRLINSMLDIMPSRGLIKHEWKKHGTCSGLSADGYFKKLRKAYQRIKIPKEFKALDDYKTVSPKMVESAFITANAGLKPNMIALTCSRNYLQEVRICMDKVLNFKPCPAVDKAACQRAKITMPPTR